MAFKKLPVNDYPIFTFEIPSTSEKKRFRPFLVKETKALLIAQGSEDQENMLNTLKSVISSACLDEINVDKLSTFDCEYLLLKLRGVSVGKIVRVKMKCDGEHETNLPRDILVDINLDNIEVADLDLSKKEVQVTDNSIVYLKYPSIDILKIILSVDSLTPNEFIEIISRCIEKIFIKDEMYDIEDLSKDDLIEWIETLPSSGYQKLVDFFDKIPYVRVKAEFDCPHCGKHNVRYLVGLDAFF